MEYIKRCKVCGHIFCYTDQDVKDQLGNAVAGIFSGIAQISSAASGSMLNMHMAGSQAERVRNQQIDLNRCPNCRSTDLETITKEELQKIMAAEALKNGANVNINTNASVESLLKRAKIFLEDSDWPTANAYCDTVLDTEPENAEAYLGKLMAELQVTDRAKLADLAEPFDSNENYKKIVRFASDELLNEILGYIEHIKNENRYKSAKEFLELAKTENDYRSTANKFKELNGYKDSEKISLECFEKAKLIKEENERKAEKARIAAEKAKIEAEKKAEADRITAEIQKKKNKKAASIVLPIIAVIAVVTVVFITVIQPMMQYNAAVSLMENGRYEEAVVAFEAMDYKDSKEKVLESKYLYAAALMEEGKYEEAVIAFENLGTYKDSDVKKASCEDSISEQKYQSAVAFMEEGKYSEAIKIFETTEKYKDSAEQIKNCKYEIAIGYMENDNYESAIFWFTDLEGYKDSDGKLKEAKIEILKKAEIGDTVHFGKYYTATEWIVLDKIGSKFFIISKDVVEAMPYNSIKENVTWEICTLREWLNNEYIDNTFSSEEQKMIIITKNSNPDDYAFGTDGGKNTNDKVFILSFDEVNKYFNTDASRLCKTNPHAQKNGADSKDDYGRTDWWTRSPGSENRTARYVAYNGAMNYFTAVDNINGVRPAMWIDLSLAN